MLECHRESERASAREGECEQRLSPSRSAAQSTDSHAMSPRNGERREGGRARARESETGMDELAQSSVLFPKTQPPS
eukprot:2409433-Rhodomonas_salina.1